MATRYRTFAPKTFVIPAPEPVCSSHASRGMAELRVVEAGNDDKSVWIVRLARTGYAVKGLTYMMLAYLAVRAALGDGRAEGTRGALREIDGPTTGDLMLLAIAAGLGAYALWKLYNAVLNPEQDRAWSRAGAGVTAFVNGGLAFEAARLGLSSARHSDGGNEAAHWTATLMGQPLGVVLVGAVGLGIALYGGSRIFKAVKSRLDDQLTLREIDPAPRRVIVAASRIGVAARGIVFILIGIFLVRAALRVNPADAKDFGHSLQELERAPSGPALLAAVALGLFLYGVYQFVRARYRRFALGAHG